MSLILEALKKLERDKTVPERGFLVVGAAARGGGGRLLAAGVLLVAAAAAGVAAWRLATPGGAPAPALPAGGAVAEAPRDGGDGGRSAPPAVAALPAPVAGPPAIPAPGPRSPEAGSPPEQAGPPAGEPEPVPAREAVAPPYRLQAISRRDGEAVAILNGRLVRVGDSFDGVRVLRIEELEVEIEAGGERIVLRF